MNPLDIIMPNTPPRQAIGDGCLMWSFGNGIDRSISKRVLAAYRRIKASRRAVALGILDVAPAYNAMAVYFDAGRADTVAIEQLVDHLIYNSADASESGRIQTHALPVRYDGPDLSRVAHLNGLDVSAVIDLHAGAEYIVAMVGFQPHFPYLIGLDDRIATPRLDSPRTHVPAGTVAIGGAQTGIYPSQSPGGWNMIGTTDPSRLVPINPGDTVIFQIS